jgi:hypothetical protein
MLKVRGWSSETGTASDPQDLATKASIADGSWAGSVVMSRSAVWVNMVKVSHVPLGVR